MLAIQANIKWKKSENIRVPLVIALTVPSHIQCLFDKILDYRCLFTNMGLSVSTKNGTLSLLHCLYFYSIIVKLLTV